MFVSQRNYKRPRGLHSRAYKLADLVGGVATVAALGVFLCLYALIWAAFFGPMLGRAVSL